jgi:hypothetical protein
MRFVVLALVLTATSCATPVTSADWAKIEGCWIDGSDLPPPASMTWRRDPARPGVLVGAWRVDIQGDVDAVDFVLEPNGGEMRVCVNSRGTPAGCYPAVFREATEADIARHAYVFYADDESIEFGSTDGFSPFFWGRRGACG